MVSRAGHAAAEPARTKGPTNTVAIGSVAAMVAVMFMGSTLVTPLYAVYRETFGFSEVTLTLIYAVYVVGNLAALLLFGRLSDEIGRRRVGLPAMAAAGVGTLLFLFATGTAWLFWARALSGFAIGLAAGSGTAWLAELYASDDKSGATLMATIANFAGLAAGPLAAGLLAQYAPWPQHLSYVVYLVALAATGILVWRTPETVRQRSRGLGGISLRPRLGIPRSIRAPFVAPAVAAFGTFAFIGLYAALIPSILIASLDQTNRAVGGAVVGELFVAAAIALPATRRLGSRTAMLSGLVLLLPGLAMLVIAQALGSMPLLLVGTALSGVSAALGYRGSLQVVNEIAPETRRAEVVSSYYVVCFLGNSVPVIGVGVITAAAGSLAASLAFAGTIATFAVAALVAGMKYTPKP